MARTHLAWAEQLFEDESWYWKCQCSYVSSEDFYRAEDAWAAAKQHEESA